MNVIVDFFVSFLSEDLYWFMINYSQRRLNPESINRWDFQAALKQKKQLKKNNKISIIGKIVVATYELNCGMQADADCVILSSLVKVVRYSFLETILTFFNWLLSGLLQVRST